MTPSTKNGILKDAAVTIFCDATVKAWDAVEIVPSNEPVNEPVISDPATVEALDKVPIEILGV